MQLSEQYSSKASFIVALHQYNHHHLRFQHHRSHHHRHQVSLSSPHDQTSPYDDQKEAICQLRAPYAVTVDGPHLRLIAPVDSRYIL